MFGCVSAKKQPVNVYPDPEPGKGLVYFFRDAHGGGIAVTYNIREGKEVLGPIKSGTYFFVQTTPGPHTYTASTETKASRTIQVEAGKTYYVKCSVEVGFFVGHPALTMDWEVTAKKILPSLQYETK